MRPRVDGEIVPSAWTADLKCLHDLPVGLRGSRGLAREHNEGQGRQREGSHRQPDYHTWKDGSGIYRIDAQTGGTSLIFRVPMIRAGVLSPEGNACITAPRTTRERSEERRVGKEWSARRT